MAKLVDYRVDVFDVDGHIKRSHPFRALDDEAALIHADRLSPGDAIELWQRGRKVASWTSRHLSRDEQ